MHRILVLLLLLNSYCFADTPIKVLFDKYPKSAKINLKILKENELVAGEDCKLIITCKDLKEDIKTYTQTIQSGDFIRIPEGNWDFEVFYKYGYSTFIATYRVKNKKTYDIEINFDSWIKIDQNGIIVGKIFDKKLSTVDFSQKKAEDFELARLGFYGLPMKGSFAPIEKSFLVNWLINKPYGGRVWYCSRLPFIIEGNNNTFFHHQVLTKLDPEKILSFYYHPSDTKVQYSLYMQSLDVPSFQAYFTKHDKYYPNLASSLVFDTIAGPIYSGLDVDITSENDLRIWYCLLNLGYQIPIVSSDYLTAADFDNTWMFLPLKESSTILEKFKAVKCGASTMSNGPALLFRIDNVLPGGSLVADNSNHQLIVQARVDPNTWDSIESFEIIRNGVSKKVPAEKFNQIFQIQFFHVFEKSYAWYVVRTKTKSGKIAISNPIFFLPEGYMQPSPATSLLKLFLNDENGDSVIGANIKIMVGDKIFHESLLEKSSFELQVPITAEIKITKEGYVDDHFFLSENEKAYELMMDLSTKDYDGPAKLADPLVYKKLREDLLVNVQHRVLKLISKDDK